MKSKAQIGVVLLCGLLFLLAGCGPTSKPSQKERVESVMRTADSLMRTRPDSALRLLYSLTPEYKLSSSGGRLRGGELRSGWLEGSHYYSLLLLDAQNKCDTVFRSDTLQRALVRYYDRHGTPNERMLAYYLLGRACHDMGEVPKALDSYLTAISVADTTSADCDYYHLCRVYGQMATIFHQQLLPEDEMQARKISEHYAWLAKDTLEALVAYEWRLGAYYLENKMDSVLFIARTAQVEYKKYGYYYKAARLLPAVISILLDRRQYDKARECMEYYEKESKLFDAQGNIAKGRELYYYYKGVYMQAMNQTDSALYYYRKVLNTGNDETAYKGLLSVYETTNNTDSIAKYARLFANANDTALLNYQRHTLRQTSAISSFNHYQKEREASKRRHLQDQNTILFIILLFGFSIIIGYFLFSLNRQKNRKKIVLLTRQYETLRMQLFLASKELEGLNSKDLNTAALLAQKSEEIARLRDLIVQQQAKIHDYSDSKLEDAFRQTDIFQLFHTLRKYHRDYIPPTNDDWDKLIKTFFHYFPHYHKILSANPALREEQLRVCVLVILHYKTDEIATLTSKSKQQVSQTKSQINRRIFGQENAKTLKSNLDEMIR